MARNRFLGIPSLGAIFFSENAAVADVVDGEVIVIDDKTYEFDDDASVGAGNVSVDISDTPTSAVLATRLVAAIGANQPTVPITAYVDPSPPVNTAGVHLEAGDAGAAGNVTFTTTMATGTSAIASVDDKIVQGENAGTQTEHRGVYIVHAVDVLLEKVIIPTGLQTVKPNQYEVHARTSVGANIAFTDQATIINNNRIMIAKTGGTNLAAGDIVIWNTWE